MLKKYIKKLNQLIPFLKNGKYFFDNSFNRLSLNKNTELNTYIQSLKSIKLFINNKIKKIFFDNKFIVYSSTKIFEGEEVIIPSSKYGYKIFNAKEVLSFFEIEDELSRYVKNKKLISKYYLVPKLKKIENKYIIEERIHDKKCDFSNFINIILNAEFNKKERIIKYNNFISYNCKNYQKIYKYFCNIIDEKFVCTIQHCDMWSGNVLYDNKKYYIIDYENVDYEYFLYDFFLFIYSEYYINNNSIYLNEFFDGKYDHIILKLDIEYDCNLKFKYFSNFLYIFCIRRFGNSKKKSIYKKLKKIDKVITYVKRRSL